MPAVSQAQARRPIFDGKRPVSIESGYFHFNAKNLIGQRFGKLEVVSEYGRNHKRAITWLCLCDCGNSVVRIGSTLIAGKSTSCGCNLYTVDAIKKRSIALRKPTAPLNKAFRACMQGARVRGLDFQIEIDVFESLTKAPCFYCGEAPSQLKSSAFDSYLANGIDRLDNNIGYSLDNCVSCCWNCNTMKRCMSVRDFIETCRKISQKHTEVCHSS